MIASKWKQQKTAAWKPEIDLEAVGRILTFFGILLLAVAFYLLSIEKVNNNVSYDYTDCRPWKGSPLTCNEIIRNRSATTDCSCPDEVIQILTDMPVSN